MNKDVLKSLIGLPLIFIIACGFALVGSEGKPIMWHLPLFALATALAFAIQFSAFIPAYICQSEKYFDLVGSLTYVSVTLLAVTLSPTLDARSLILAAMVLIWAVRLGSFLFARIHKSGKDGRFDAMKPSFIRFLAAWMLQGLWVTFTAAAAIAAITSTQSQPLGLIGTIGTLLWIVGFAIEAIADAQKKAFTADPKNQGRFIDTGLWSRSRHPNYFGEIILWTGVALLAFPVLQGWQYVALSSPFLVALLLTKVSGIPLLERRADAKWGGQADYESYKERTPVLIPHML